MMIFMRYICEMRFHVLVSEFMKETECHNIGMLMNMQANALKMQDFYRNQLPNSPKAQKPLITLIKCSHILTQFISYLIKSFLLNVSKNDIETLRDAKEWKMLILKRMLVYNEKGIAQNFTMKIIMGKFLL